MDRALAAGAVVVPPDCNILGPLTGCSGGSLQYTATINVASQTTSFQWSLINNTAGATISGTSSGTINGGEITVPQLRLTL
jgi:hypothetical protein